ncbi:hypothetical protein M0R45_035699 [Rubus argutus]|uniref:RNase H type-1 domain-containing protein n=1 Tax=Rubus argutus TaxID=59490 RepID=A0AAW1VVM9_RUBAR
MGPLFFVMALLGELVMGHLLFFWKGQGGRGAGILKEYALDSSLVDNDLVVQDFWSNNDWIRLLTNVNRTRRKLTLDPCCPHCPGQPETMIHLFRDCPKAGAIWNAMGRPATMQRTYNLDGRPGLQPTFSNQVHVLEFKWSHLFIFTCWFIWKWRNKYIFDDNFKGPHNAYLTIIQYMVGKCCKPEAWGCILGLQIAKDLGLNHIMVESDSAVLMALLQSADIDLHPLGIITPELLPVMLKFVVADILDDMAGRTRPRAIHVAASANLRGDNSRGGGRNRDEGGDVTDDFPPATLAPIAYWVLKSSATSAAPDITGRRRSDGKPAAESDKLSG